MTLRSLSKKLLILFPILLFSVPVGAEDILGEASILEKAGKFDEAAQLYREWLENNPSDIRYTDILLHGSSLISQIDKSISFLLDHIVYLSVEDSVTVYREVADLYSLSFRLSEAADYYRMAARMKGENPDPELMLEYYKLKYQAGEIPDNSELNSLLMSDLSPRLYVDILIFKAEILKSQDDFTEAIELLIRSPYSSIYPEVQYALWELYGLERNAAAQQRIVSFLRNSFPGSVELSLIEGSVKKVPRLSDFFLGTETLPLSVQETAQYYIQTGVFRREENARLLKEDLQNKGFNVIIYNDRGSNRVIVTGEESPDILLSRLREKGFSGFKIDYPGDPD